MPEEIKELLRQQETGMNMDLELAMEREFSAKKKYPKIEEPTEYAKAAFDRKPYYMCY